MSVALQLSENPSTNVLFSSLPAAILRRSPPNLNTCPAPVAPGPGESRDSLEEPEHAERGVSSGSWCVVRRANELANCIASSILRSSAADNWRIPLLTPLLVVDESLDDDDDGIIYTVYTDNTTRVLFTFYAVYSVLQKKNCTSLCSRILQPCVTRVEQFSAKCSERNCLHDKGRCQNKTKHSWFHSWQENYVKAKLTAKRLRKIRDINNIRSKPAFQN